MQTRLLLVDDDEEFTGVLAEILEDNNYCVNKANDGEKALKFIEEEGCDIVLLDLKIPKIDGYTVLKYIRKKKLAVKVIILTGAPVDENILGGGKTVPAEAKYKDKLLGLADAVINKPFDVDFLLGKIKETKIEF